VAIYSIKDLEKLSGIKAHTIRIWEQRYNLIKPSRTKTNIRYYEDSELKLLLNVALLNKNGIKISKLATMSRQEISEKVSAIAAIDPKYDTQLDALTIAMIEMDESKFDRILSTNIQQVGFEKTMMEVIYPFLERLSLLWLTGSVSPVQEHFMSYLLRQKVICAIDREPLLSGRGVKKFIIYLPQGDQQELSLLFMHYLLKSRRNHVIYLGLDIQLEDLANACAVHQPDYIFTFINEPLPNSSSQRYVDTLAEQFPNVQIMLSGYLAVTQPLVLPTNVVVVKSLPETIRYIDQLALKLMRSLGNVYQ
jgi:MerR family transcriptional regulator, light-induced transcriptional regulator